VRAIAALADRSGLPRLPGRVGAASRRARTSEPFRYSPAPVLSSALSTISTLVPDSLEPGRAAGWRALEGMRAAFWRALDGTGAARSDGSVVFESRRRGPLPVLPGGTERVR